MSRQYAVAIAFVLTLAVATFCNKIFTKSRDQHVQFCWQFVGGIWKLKLKSKLTGFVILGGRVDVSDALLAFHGSIRSSIVAHLVQTPYQWRPLRTAAAKPGSHLIREWNGRTYQVEVTGDSYMMDGKTWRSLSAVARQITVAQWSGLRAWCAGSDAPSILAKAVRKVWIRASTRWTHNGNTTKTRDQERPTDRIAKRPIRRRDYCD